jgi:signal transduction histidine kinase
MAQFNRRRALRPLVLDLRVAIAAAEGRAARILGDDVALEVIVPAVPVFVAADRHQVERALAKLVVNAHEAMPYGGRLVLDVAPVHVGHGAVDGLPPGRYARLAVSDTGDGMDEETTAQVFDPFFTTKHEGLGQGLGLPTVYGIVTRSGGGIAIDSQPGSGTTVAIYLPLVRHGAAGLTARESPRSSRSRRLRRSSCSRAGRPDADG